jgi:biotin-(acetyl-CoA carboxylase) ligase
MENWKVKQVLSESWHQWEGRGYKERMWEGDYSGNIMYSCLKMEK